jgi:hypothetical protein
MAGFKDSLVQAVRKLAFKTSVDALKKRGIEQVSVLGMDRIVSLIEESVYRSLKSRLVGMEREAVADATKAEFLRLLRSNEDLKREKSAVEQLKERAEEEVDHLRRELAKEQRILDRRLKDQTVVDAARYEGENAAIAERVREVFAVMGQFGPGVSQEMQERMLELVIDTVTAERKQSEEARRALRDREVENLQRRIQKLSETLTTTEHKLRQVAAMKNIDDGVSSIYREVQGLADGDDQRTRKKELMAEIFAANLRLQKRPVG